MLGQLLGQQVAPEGTALCQGREAWHSSDWADKVLSWWQQLADIPDSGLTSPGPSSLFSHPLQCLALMPWVKSHSHSPECLVFPSRF